MSHIDEGLLHAWLDRERSGLTPQEAADIAEHLESCVGCASRLEEARLLSDQANALLAQAVPNRIVAPDFRTISARASGRSPSAGRPGRSSWVKVAWAASLFAALGLGWWTRDLLRSDQIAMEEGGFGAEESQSAPTVVANEVPQMESAVAPSEGVAAPATPVAGEPAPTYSERIGAVAGPVPVPEISLDGMLSSLENPVSNLPPPPAQAGSAGAARDFDAQANDVGGGRLNDADQVTFQETRLPDGAGIAAPPAPPTSVAAAPTARNLAQRSGARAESQGTWRAASLAEAERLLGAAVPRIVGITPLSVQVADAVDGVSVRFVQEVGGVPVTLTISRATGIAEETAGSGSSVYTVRRGEMFVTAVASIPLPDLARIADRIE